jgi:mRNA-degrading endonuclease RelE of RelBE toxin-antitoxin system
MILGSGKSGQIPYVMDNYGMSYTDVINTLKRGDPLIEGLATGGRAGFRVGKKVIEKIVKPKKTLKSIEETGMIDISDPDIAEEFAKFMKQMDPEGSAKIQKIVDDINQKIELKNFKTKDRKENSDGGRIGLKVGSPSKRAFLKVMGGLAATLAAIKSGLIGTGGKEVTKQVVKESAKDVANAPPKYFFDLANKIKLFGKESKVKPQERVNEYNYTGKNGDQYTLTEDVGTGDMQITKDKIGIGTADEKSFDTINDRSIMEYRAPRKDVDPDSEKFLKEGAEYDEYKVEFDMDGTMGDGDVISENIKKEIIQEASDIPEKKIKRAGGGVAYMLGE